MISSSKNLGDNDWGDSDKDGNLGWEGGGGTGGKMCSAADVSFGESGTVGEEGGSGTGKYISLSTSNF